MSPSSATAAARWRDSLARWAIPASILEAAPESPWVFPVELFARRADAASDQLTASNRAALEALEAGPAGGAVLDVGSGAGAASIPLAREPGRVTRFMAVDSSAEMLDAFAERAGKLGVPFEAIHGRWPDVAGETPVADLVVCHHVAYNAPDLDRFALRLTDHARRRVVMELTPNHPTANLNPLWQRFHGLERPTEPTATDAEAVLREARIEPHRLDTTIDAGGGFARREDLVAWVRRRLCLTADRDHEVDEALTAAGELEERAGLFGFPARPVVTLWWDGSAEPG